MLIAERKVFLYVVRGSDAFLVHVIVLAYTWALRSVDVRLHGDMWGLR